MVKIGRNQPAPESGINPALAFGSLQLEIEIFDGCCRGNGIKRHVHDGGHTSAGSSLCSGCKAFPLSPAGFVQMDMCIYKTWHDDKGIQLAVGNHVVLGEHEISIVQDAWNNGEDLTGVLRINDRCWTNPIVGHYFRRGDGFAHKVN
ncbi:hypothetical protein OGATHE_005930 [Ogataea polymorpha]|uniref:Uncharacterized protein n=1 Tax=Ogataea polymorpha TaxID=460523 RepID=A0A9P8SZI8_9ASCO|nr:hypothetical protein OGATHE_005930 [Ogataea polymorpha]